MRQPNVDVPGGGQRGRRRRRVAVAAAVLVPLLLGGCQLPTWGAFRGSTTQAQDTYKLWQGFFLAGLVVGGIVLVLILWSVVRYRRRPNSGDELPKQFQYQLPLEILYTVMPILIVLALFSFTVITENEVDAVAKDPPVTVNVLAFQWGWRFTYPGQGVTVVGQTTQDPEMVVPAGETVHINLRSADVVHGFYVPQFSFSRYALPGVLNQFDLNVTHTGTFRGQCTQLCGLYHSLMFFRVKAVTPSEYQGWLQQHQAGHRYAASTSSNAKGA